MSWRSPFVWAPIAVVFFAATCLYPNLGLGANINYDPQGLDQELEVRYSMAVFALTSGALFGQLVALAFGAAIVRRRHERAPRAGTLAFVIGGGALLGLLHAAVAVGLAAWSLDLTLNAHEAATAAAAGLTFDPHLLRDPGVVRLIAGEYTAFPLFAALGAGVGALVRRRRWLVPAVAGWYVVQYVVTAPALNHASPLLALTPTGSALAAAFLTTEDQRIITHAEQHGSPTLAIAYLLGSTLLYALVANLAARYRARRSPNAAER